MANQARDASLMQPLAEASVAKSVPTPAARRAAWEPESRAASKSGHRAVDAVPRYSHGIRPTQMYQVSVAAMSSVMMPASVPKGSARAGERTSSAAWRGALDAEVEPEAEMDGGEHADPAIGQRRLSRHQLGMVHLARCRRRRTWRETG